MSIFSVKIEIIEFEDVKIYRMATLDNNGQPLMWVSSFLIDGILIDCGHQHAKDEFLKTLDFDYIEKSVLSHHHEDHFGATFDLINRYNIPVFGNKETAFLINMPIRIPPERMLTWGKPKPCKINELPNLNEIKTSKGSLKIIPSPGHCNNLISFFHKKKKFLFATDAFIDKRQSILFNWENPNLMTQTIEKFKSLHPKYIFSANSNIFTTEDLDELLLYWNEIKIRSIELYDSGIKPRNIMKQIFGRETSLKRATKGDLSRENLVRSLIGLEPLFKNRF